MTDNEMDKSPSSGASRFLSFLAGKVVTMAAGVRKGFARLVSFRTLLTLAIGLLLLHLFGVIAIPFPPFTTTGKIYVDSPEVYTRERLVNDRYNQDYWLRERIKKLDEPENLQLVVGEEFQSVTARAGDVAAEGDAKRESGPESKVGRLSFEQEFRVASGIRDMIRQQILENMLDDRHDLTGNSVYGLKFDTTVIPGNNTRRRAFVHVALQVDDLFRVQIENANRLDGNVEGWLGDNIEGWIASQLVTLRGFNARETIYIKEFKKRENYYLTWLTDIARRLNQAEDSVYASMRDACFEKGGRGFYDKLTGKTLENILGIPEEMFFHLNPPPVEGPSTKGYAAQFNTWVKLPDPWARFFRIEREPFGFPDEIDDQPCDYRVLFLVYELNESFMLVKSTDAVRDPSDSDKKSIRIGESEDGKWKINVWPWEFQARKNMFQEAETPKYPMNSEFIEKILAVKKLRCERGVEEASLCENLSEIVVHSGFFNFVEHLSARDAYSYAIFPKNDVVGVFAETQAQLAAAAPATGFFDLVRRLTESTTSSVLIGYGHGGGGGLAKDEKSSGHPAITFGWVVSARNDMEPTQKSQLALVSVPAWTDKLDLRVSVGWLDRHGSPMPVEDGTFDLSIAVPPNLEVFDSIFREDARVTLGPTIRDNQMDQDIYVRAGKKTKILIPGSRLWRSASVTLGAQAARRIWVLPNMEGIIAEFDPVDPPYAAYNEETDAKRSQEALVSAVVDQAVDGPRRQDKTEPCSRKIDKIQGHNLRVRAVRLRVWTSEGVDQAQRPVCVIYDPVEVLSTAPGGAEPASR